MESFDEDHYRTHVLIPMVDSFSSEGLFDIFARYGIDIDCNDDSLISATVGAVEVLWQRNSNNPKYSAVVYMALKPEERQKSKALSVAPKRAQLVAEVKQLRRLRLEKRCKKLDLAIGTLAAKGYLTLADRDALLAAFERELSPQVIEERLKSISIKDDALPVQAPPEGLPIHVRESLRTFLAVVEEPDLYHFMGVKKGERKEVWKDRHDELDRLVRSERRDATNTAKSRLLSIVHSTLILEGDPRFYDEAFVYDMLTGEFDTAIRLAARDGRIDARAFSILLNEACQFGVDKAEAETGLLWLAAKHGAFLDVTTPASGMTCPACYYIIEEEAAESCPMCKTPLRHPCQKCGIKYFAGLWACTACRYPRDDARWRALLELVAFSIQRNDLAEANRNLLVAEQIWAARDTEMIRSRLKSAELEQLEWEKRYRQAAAQSEWVLVEGLLRDAPFADPNQQLSSGLVLQEVRIQVQKVLAEANGRVATALQLQLAGRMDDAVAEFEEAIALVHDLEAAKSGLAHCKPTAPSELRGHIEGGAVHLLWTVSRRAESIKYQIRRSEAGSAEETTIAETNELTYLDNTIVHGASYTYSVVASRYGAMSNRASTEVLATLPVSEFSLQSNNGSIQGFWRPLPSNARALVRRGSNVVPASLRDGDAVETSLNGFQDWGLLNETTYCYLVCVEYRTRDGRTLLSEPRQLAAMPSAPPLPVNHLEFHKVEDKLHIEWVDPGHSSVTIYQSKHPPPPGWRSGAGISIFELNSWGTALKNADRSRTAACMPEAGLSYFVAASSNRHSTSIGTVWEWVDVQEVTALEGRNLGQHLMLIWEWPSTVDFVMVAQRFDRFPISAHDPAAELSRCTRAAYLQAGGFRVNQPLPEIYHLSVFAGMSDGRNDVYGSGSRVRIDATQKIEIRYTIRRKMFSDFIALQLESSALEAALPSIVVVARRGELQPVSADEGKVVAEINAAILSPRFRHEFSVAERPAFIRAFFKGPHGPYVLRDPPSSQLKLT